MLLCGIGLCVVVRWSSLWSTRNRFLPPLFLVLINLKLQLLTHYSASNDKKSMRIITSQIETYLKPHVFGPSITRVNCGAWVVQICLCLSGSALLVCWFWCLNGAALLVLVSSIIGFVEVPPQGQTVVTTSSSLFSTSPKSLDLDQSLLLGCPAVPVLAVSSSPRLWIDVFALPEKLNMAVTESNADPKVRTMSITF